MMHKYYEILGVNENSTLPQIKAAYRKRALQLHPDRNKSPNAHEEFVMLVEAYETVVNYKSGSYTYTTTAHTDYINREQQRRQEARRRAEEQARMKYEEYIKSDFYKNVTALEALTTMLYTGFFVLIALVFLVAVGYEYGLTGVLIGLVPISAISFFIYRSNKETFPPVSEIPQAFNTVLKTKAFKVAVPTLLNIITLFTFGFRTLISFWLLAAGFAFVIFLTYMSFYFIFKSAAPFTKRLYSFCIAPCFLSFLLAINFSVSSNPVMETYRFNNVSSSNNGMYESAVIDLQDNKYAEYAGIRVFTDYREMRGKKTITYTFADGLLGFRVMKGYKFE